ncbi:MAG: hypothetical protein KKC03_13290 [Bacteroidetes bacterium]|nr:hypothetical protein [Bacteroidota bacterium]
MKPTNKKAPTFYNRLPIFGENIDDFVIHGGVVGQDFFQTEMGSYWVKYRYKKTWAIFQFYVSDKSVFPITSEPDLCRVIGPSSLPFFLDWTAEADSWFLAVNFGQDAMMMTKPNIDRTATRGLEALTTGMMPPAHVIRRHVVERVQRIQAWRMREVGAQQ